MARHSEILAEMRRAIEVEEPGAAISLARELSIVDLSDSLDLVRLLARRNDPRFEPFAIRWVTRFVVEPGAPLQRCQLAMATMLSLAADPDDDVIVRSLKALAPPLV